MDFNETDRFSITIRISCFIKIRPVGTELFHADGQTDTTKLIVVFRNFANATKKIPLCTSVSHKGRYSSNDAETRNEVKMSAQFHAPAALLPGKAWPVSIQLAAL
jgi:hypothetical protein